jgi:hypothetical protein
MSQIKFKVAAGGASAEIGGPALKALNDLLDKVAPKTKQAMIDYTTDLEEGARRNWIVRKKNSQRSIDKFYTVFYISPDFKISAGVGNKAVYAFAIKVGKDSKTKIAEGKNLAIETLWKPAQKEIDKLVDKIGDELIKGFK